MGVSSFKVGRLERLRVVRRISRFTVLLEGSEGRVLGYLHNTGRLHGVLEPGAIAFCTPLEEPRKCRYRVVGIGLGGWSRAAVVDTAVQERAFERWMLEGAFPWLRGVESFARHVEVEGSRIDYLVRFGGGRAFLELKSAVSLLENGYACFPDAPTARGRRHVEALARLRRAGERSIIAFVVSHPMARGFAPCWHIDPLFAEALLRATLEGVEVYALKAVLDVELSAVVLEEASIHVNLRGP